MFLAEPATTLLSGMPRPEGVAVDGAGNVYIANNFQNAIERWTATNNTLTILGSGLSYSSSVAVDTAGNVYFNGGALQEWTATNNAVEELTSWNPSEFTVDGAGSIYSSGGNSILAWTPGNKIVTSLVLGLNGVGNVAVDIAGNVYFGDGDGIQVWTAANNAVTLLVPPGSYSFGDLAVDGAGNLYLVAQDAYLDLSAIVKWTAVSKTLTTMASSWYNPFYCAEFFGVAVDGADSVYFTDWYGGVVYELPSAFVDTTPRREGAAAGQDSLPPVLPNTMNLNDPFAPSSDSAWLTITGVTNGVVSFSFPANPSFTAIGHITLLGQSISVIVGPSFALGTTNLYEGPAAGSDSVVLAVTPNSGMWTATTNAPWLHLSPIALSGTGSTNVVFSFDANPGATRSGTLTIAGQTLTVTQAGSTYVQTGPVSSLVSSGLSGPYGVAVDAAGNVYIADAYDNTIKEWTVTNNTVTTLVSSGLNRPQGVAVDGAGNVYVADTFSSAIKEWTAANNTVTTLVSSGLNRPQGVAVDGAGNVYIADTFNSAVKQWIATSSNLVTLVSSGLDFPVGVAVDKAGNVYIADTGNSAIKEWTAAGHTVSTLLSLGLGYPSGVAVDGSGNVYFADADNLVIEKWTAASNTVMTLMSSGLNDPSGVAVGGSDNVYFSDAYNRTVRELPYAFVDPKAKLEGPAAGSDVLPVVLPATANLLGQFAPISDQAWLNITGITNGVVSFAFGANTGRTNRTAYITLLSQPISITQAAVTPPTLLGPRMLSNGRFQFAFSNNDLGVSFTMLTTTNLSLPLTNWTVIGSATNITPGVFQFSTDTTNSPQGFYRARSP